MSWPANTIDGRCVEIESKVVIDGLEVQTAVDGEKFTVSNRSGDPLRLVPLEGDDLKKVENAVKAAEKLKAAEEADELTDDERALLDAAAAKPILDAHDSRDPAYTAAEEKPASKTKAKASE